MKKRKERGKRERERKERGKREKRERKERERREMIERESEWNKQIKLGVLDKNSKKKVWPKVNRLISGDLQMQI